MSQVDVILDSAHGSSGKGKLSTWLADHYKYRYVSSANLPNAGHSAVMDDGVKFVSKAIPTAGILNRYGQDLTLLVTPGSAFRLEQLTKEWEQCGEPRIIIHERAGVVTEEHAARERQGTDSTAHIASTMQGSGAWLSDKILRKENASLVGNYPRFTQWGDKVRVLNGQGFRDAVHNALDNGSILHEGSQGYALSIDHGNSYPTCTSRNCTTAAALDYLGVAPQRLGRVWLNLRSYPIRVGSIAEGSSGPFYADSQEITWAKVAQRSGMPAEEAAQLAERERTTVTKRVRRVATFSFDNLRDAVRTNGVTHLCLNFVSYLNWADEGVTDVTKLSKETRILAARIEDAVNIPVCLFGTGAKHSEMCVEEKYL